MLQRYSQACYGLPACSADAAACVGPRPPRRAHPRVHQQVKACNHRPVVAHVHLVHRAIVERGEAAEGGVRVAAVEYAVGPGGHAGQVVAGCSGLVQLEGGGEVNGLLLKTLMAVAVAVAVVKTLMAVAVVGVNGLLLKTLMAVAVAVAVVGVNGLLLKTPRAEAVAGAGAGVVK